MTSLSWRNRLLAALIGLVGGMLLFPQAATATAAPTGSGRVRVVHTYILSDTYLSLHFRATDIPKKTTVVIAAVGCNDHRYGRKVIRLAGDWRRTVLVSGARHKFHRYIGWSAVIKTDGEEPKRIQSISAAAPKGWHC